MGVVFPRLDDTAERQAPTGGHSLPAQAAERGSGGGTVKCSQVLFDLFDEPVAGFAVAVDGVGVDVPAVSPQVVHLCLGGGFACVRIVGSDNGQVAGTG